MRPRHYAAENPILMGQSFHGMVRFNEAAALRRGKPISLVISASGHPVLQ